ncbi:DUF4199 domain-containing protein [Prolixibacteraceae bacterium A06]|uniref:DUF4199 domain-containing protein n=2 Tax=Gaoshiqia sediminis TaxID=2986998 RepID=A0AA41Y6M8_9BACT|nr:DUF4199 domain-containing protein [Gaoshiqia sediminis]
MKNQIYLSLTPSYKKNIMEQKSTFWKSAMTYGLYLGIALILYNVLLYVAGQNLNTTLGLVSYLIMAAGVFYSQIHYRNTELNGFISYSQALGFGIVVMLFAGVIQSLYSVILIKYLDPSILDQIRVMQEEALMERGMSDEQIEAVGQMMTKMQSPLVIAISGLLTFGFIGFIISLVTSIFVKKNDEENAFAEAMGEIKDEE